MKDIADMAGVSKTTVSIVLNDRTEERKISKETKDKIWDIVNKLNYKPSSLARSLRSRKSHTIGFLMADISNVFYAKISRIIEDLSWDKGYQVLFGSTEELGDKEEILINDLVNRQVDGLIIASSNPNSKVIKQLVHNEYPLVLIDRDAENLDVNSIVIDNKGMMQKAVERLIRLGKRRIGLLSITPHIYTLKNRIEGYKAALKKHKIKVDDNLILHIDYKNIREDSYNRLEELIDQNVDCIVFTNNQVATETLIHIKTKYKPLLNTLEFAVFDNTDIFDYIPSNITSIAQPIHEIATKSVELLFNSIEGKKEKQKLVLEGEMIVRN